MTLGYEEIIFMTNLIKHKALIMEFSTVLLLYFLCLFFLPQTKTLVFLVNFMFAFFLIVLYKKKYSLRKLGFYSDKLYIQIIWGLIYLLILVGISVNISTLLGKKVASININFHIKDFVIHDLLIAFSEELFFRAFFIDRVLDILNSKTAAIILSSFMFGLIHIVSYGILVQFFFTAFVGLIFSISYISIKNFSIVSLTLSHGLYNFFIKMIVWQ